MDLKKLLLNLNIFFVQAEASTKLLQKDLKKVILTNNITLSAILITLSYIPVFSYFKLQIGIFITLCTAVGFTFPLLANKMGYFKSSKFMFILVACMALFIFSQLYGKESGAHLILFPFVALSMLLVTSTEEKITTLAAAIPAFTLILLEFSGYQLVINPHPIPDSVRAIFYKAGMLTGIAFSFLFSYLSYRATRAYEEELEQTNWVIQKTLVQTQAKKNELEKNHQKFKTQTQAELATVKSIQRHLNAEFIPEVKDFDIEVVYQPCSEIGGDYYDFFQIGQDIYGVIADVTGKGLSANLMATHFRYLIHHKIPLHTAPNLFMKQLNSHIIKNKFLEKGVACIYWHLNTKTKVFTYSIAGMNPLIFIPQNGEVSLDESVSGPILGMFEDYEFPIVQYVLKPGDRIVMFTDGIIDQKNAKNENLSLRKWTEIVEQHRYSKNFLNDSLVNFKFQTQHQPQSDDLTILSIRHPVNEEDYNPKVSPVLDSHNN